MQTCTTCSRSYIYVRGKGHTKNRCNTCLVNDRRFKLKERMLTYKGGKCQFCGYNKCEQALSFHHIDPTTKRFTISGAHCRSWSVLKAELDKCVLTCENCHREIHAGQLTIQ